MRRVVYATKADDLRSAQAQYDAELAELTSKYEEQEDNWRTAAVLEEKETEQAVIDRIGPTDLDLRVRANSRWRNGFEVTIDAKGSKALRWEIEIILNDDGTIAKKSNSWSGLEATTKEQVEELKESVRVIEKINNIDWSAILHTSEVEYDDYVDDETRSAMYDKKKNRPDFEQDIVVAELEDLIGTDTWVKLKGSPTEQFGHSYHQYTYWAKIKKVTPAQFLVELCNTPGQSWSDEYRVKKSNFIDHLVKPIEISKGEVTE